LEKIAFIFFQLKKEGIFMEMKKSLIVALCLLVIPVLIWGIATPALSETLNCKGEGKSAPLKMISDSTGLYFLGVSESEDAFTCDNGETGTGKGLFLWDRIERKELLSLGYSILTFKDNSQIIMKSKSKLSEIPDPNEVKGNFVGTADILRGNRRFNGIKGSVSFKGKVNGDNIVIESTLTFTLPKK
jgi:hypothetical protein